MNQTLTVLRLFSLCTALLLCGSLFTTEAKRRSKRHSKAAAQSESAEDQSPELFEGQVRLKLSDGTLMPVDDAWENRTGSLVQAGQESPTSTARTREGHRTRLGCEDRHRSRLPKSTDVGRQLKLSGASNPFGFT